MKERKKKAGFGDIQQGAYVMEFLIFIAFLVVALVVIKIVFVIRNNQTLKEMTADMNRQGMADKAREEEFGHYTEHQLCNSWIDFVEANRPLSYDKLLEKAHAVLEEASQRSGCIDFYADGINQTAEKLATVSTEEQQSIRDSFQVKLVFKEFAMFTVGKMEKQSKERLASTLRSLRSQLH